MATTHKGLENTLRESYTQEQFIDNFIYLTNKSRGKNNYVTERTLIKKYQYGGMATLLKKYDPTAYYCALRD